MLRYLLALGLFCGVIYPLSAQRYGLSLGYTYGLHSGLDEAIKHFNFTHPEHARHPFVRHGFYGSAEFSFPIRSSAVFFASPRLTYWQVQSTSRSFIFPVKSITRGIAAQLNIDYYAFVSIGRGNPRSFFRNLFFNLHGGGAYILHQISTADERLQIKGKTYAPTATTPFAGLGIGYDIFTLPVFSFTPELRAGYVLPFEFEDLGTAYTGGSLLKVNSKSSRIYFQFGIAMRLHHRRTTYR